MNVPAAPAPREPAATSRETTPCRLRALPALLVVLVAAGCGMAPEARVVTSVNSYDFYLARYGEACVEVAGPPACDQTYAALERWRRRLDEAQAAIVKTKKGGKLPLQLRELRLLEKETKKWQQKTL